MSADEEAGIVYLPISLLPMITGGGFRLGRLIRESIVALDIETGERIWHFQTVHHGVCDVASAPNLVDIEVDGKAIKAIAQSPKQRSLTCLIALLENRCGQSRKGLSLKVTSREGDLHPTQPFPTKPAPFDRQGISEDDLIDFTPEIAEAAREMAKEYVPVNFYATNSPRQQW